MGHRVAPDALVDLLALEDLPVRVGEELEQLELAPREVDGAGRRRRPGTGRRGSRARPRRPGACSSGLAARLRRRTTASTRATTSSGWQGLLTQSSAPSRRPRTRWATVDCSVHDDDAEAGQLASTTRSRNSQARGPSSVRSTTIAFSRIATSSSSGTGAGERAVLPARALEALGQHPHEAAVRVDDRESYGTGRGDQLATKSRHDRSRPWTVAPFSQLVHKTVTAS